MTDVIDVLKALWDAYGKNRNENQIRVYVKWASTTEVHKLKKVVDIWIGNEKFFPALSDLKSLYASQNKTYADPNNYEDCWYCGGVGMIPSIITKEDHHYITNYGCKCSNAVTTGIQNYFRTFDELEDKEYAVPLREEYTYPQIVDKYLRDVLMNAERRIVEF